MTTLSTKSRKKPDACDISRCRQREQLTIVEDPVHGRLKLCSTHLEQYNGEAKVTPPPAAPAADPMPVHETVLAAVEPVRAEAAAQLVQLAEIKITSQPGVEAAGKFLQQVKGKAKTLETERTKVTKPLLEAKRTVDGWFKPAKEALNMLEAHLKSAINTYLREQEAARLAALQAGDHEGALATEQPTLPAGVQQRTIWKWRVTDPALVPDEYKVIDSAKVTAQVNEHKGNTAIPGIEAYADTSIASGST